MRIILIVPLVAALIISACISEESNQPVSDAPVPDTGLEWTRVADSLVPVDTTLWSIAANDSGFVAVTSSTILTSSDGRHWDSQPTILAKCVEWNGEQFYIFGQSLNFYTSTDGTDWAVNRSGEHAPSQPQFLAWCDSLFIGIAGGQQLQSFNMSSDGREWRCCYGSGHIFALAATWWHGRFYAAGDRVRSSVDGCSWQVVDSAAEHATRWFQAMATNDSTIIAAGNYGLILVSKDGEIWEVAPKITNETIREIIWTGSLFVAVGGTWGERAMVWTSPDGYQWTSRLEVPGGILLDVAMKGDTLVAVGEMGGVYLSSP